MQEDEQCYRRFLEGDKAALEELIAIHRQGLTLFLFGIVQDMDKAEDLLIDTFANLMLTKSKFKHKASLKTYLFAIGRNLAYKAQKNKRQDKILPLSEAAEIPTEMQEHFLKDERNTTLYAAMQRLNADYRMVLILLYFEDSSYKEAGAVLHKTEKQIADLAYRAKGSLKKLLEQEGFTYVDE